MKQPPEKSFENPKSLLVTVKFNPKKSGDLSKNILGLATEFYGIHLEDKSKTPTNREMTILFEKNKFGEEFYEVLSFWDVKISKENC